jgi:hypothetical protein
MATTGSDGPWRVFLGSIGFAFAFFGVERLTDGVHSIESAISLFGSAFVIELVAFKWVAIRNWFRRLRRGRHFDFIYAYGWI